MVVEILVILFIILAIILALVYCNYRNNKHGGSSVKVAGGRVKDPSRIKKKTLKAFDEFCYPKSYKLQPQQKFVDKYFRDDKHLPASALLFHKIGSGKTCTSIRIGLALANNGRRPLYLMPASLIPGFYNEMRSPCGKVDIDAAKHPFALDIPPDTDPTSKEYRTAVTKSNAAIDKLFQIYSYNKFANSTADIDPNTPAIIIDEVQNINNPSGTYYNAIFNWITEHPKVSIILLSATPLFDNVGELYGLAKLMYAFDTRIKLQIDDKSSIKHLFSRKSPRPVFISFYAGAPDYTFPEVRVHVSKCVMSDFQTKWYQSEVAAELTARGDIRMETVPNNFYIKSRQRSNVVYPKGLVDESSLTPQLIRENLQTYSCKWARLVRRLNNGKLSFIYTNFTGAAGIAGIVHVLEVLGWKDFAKDGPGHKRFAIWSGDESGSQKNIIREVFNSTKNDNGSQIRVIIGSPAIKEGVSLFRVRQVHVMEAYWNHSRLEQIFGRAVRYCSHKRLDPIDRDVDIYIYAAVTAKCCPKKPMPDTSIDLYMLEIADKKKEEMDPIIAEMKKVAI